MTRLVSMLLLVLPHAALAAGDADHGGHAAPGPDWAAIGWHAFNLVLFIGLIVWVARRPLGDELRRRDVDIRKSLTDAARARDEARQRHEELGARITRFEDELQTMLDDAREEAAKEEAKLIEHTRHEAARIAQTTERNIRDEVMRAQVALRKEAVELSVDLARSTLQQRVQGDDQRRIARQFLDAITQDEVNGNG